MATDDRDEMGVDQIGVGEIRSAETGEVVGHTLAERRGATVAMHFVWADREEWRT